jgi:hypothetical protein
MIRRLWSSSEEVPDRISPESNSALRSGKSDQDIERSVTFWESFAEVSACVVIIGLVLEYWSKLNGIAAPLMVVLGIAGEVLFARLAASRQD